MDVIDPLAAAGGAQGLPGVKLTGLVIGAILLGIAVRAMFGRKR